MAVGDVVNGISAINTIITFQPAAGVECMISSNGLGAAGAAIVVTDGILTSWQYSTLPRYQVDTGNMKLFINNAIYLRVSATPGSSGSYSGIQTK